MSAEFVSGFVVINSELGNRPSWHMQDNQIPEPVNIPDAMRIAGIADVNATSMPVFVQKPDGTFVPAPAFTGIVNSGDDTVFTIAGDKRKVFQYADNFMPIHHDLASIGLDKSVIAGNLLRNKGIATLTLDFTNALTSDTLPDGTKMGAYLNLIDSQDGSYSLSYLWSMVRIVCCNTAGSADRSAIRAYRMKHCATLPERRDEASKLVTGMNKYADAVIATARKLIDIKVTDDEAMDIIAKLIPIKDEQSRGATIAKSQRYDVWGVYTNAGNQHPDQEPIHGNMWGLYNAASFVGDHLARFNNSKNGTSAENKFVANVVKGDTLGNQFLSLVR